MWTLIDRKIVIGIGGTVSEGLFGCFFFSLSAGFKPAALKPLGPASTKPQPVCSDKWVSVTETSRQNKHNKRQGELLYYL